MALLDICNYIPVSCCNTAGINKRFKLLFDAVCASDGGEAGTVFTPQDTTSIDLTLASNILSAAVKISPDSENTLELRGNGLYTPTAQVYTCSNGLTAAGNNFMLGGVLTESTVIDGVDTILQLNSTLTSTGQFCNALFSFNSITLSSSNQDSSNYTQFDLTPTASFWKHMVGGNFNQFYWLTDGRLMYEENITNKRGLTYSHDSQADWTTRTLVTKAYVDTALSAISGITPNNTYVVASQAAMLASGAGVGDIAVRSDTNTSYILKTAPATTLVNWVQLLSPGSVTSVFGRTGTVIAATNDYTFAQIGSKPSTLAGYGITDAALKLVTFNSTPSGASYTLLLTDAEKVVETNHSAANNLVVPLNSSVAFPIGTTIQVAQFGAGQTTIVATGGVTLLAATGALKFAYRYSVATLIKKGTDTWYVCGDLIT